MLLWLVFTGLVYSAQALDNGLALTPPMGWLSWQRFRCITDCKKYPQDCISENLIKRTADLMTIEGYLSAGYNYVGIDDCWLEKQRGPDGRMVPDRKRFPSGMKALSDYIHERGLKFGMYQDYGTHTCGGYPGVLGHEQLDIDTFVSWEIDYLKLDGCYIKQEDMDTGYPKFGNMMNKTGRPIVYSCSWPAYQEFGKRKPNYGAIAKSCNLWRNWGDIQDSWTSLKAIINWFGNNQNRLAKFAGPGHWNDPDMLIIGNFGLSVDQARVQMALWSILAAPLFMSVDLATIRPEFKEILLNKDIIAIDQDKLGKQGWRVWKSIDSDARKGLEVWKRDLSDGSHALAFVNQREDGVPYVATFTYAEMALIKKDYEVQDLYKEEPNKLLQGNKNFEVRINPTGVKFYKFIPRHSSENEEVETKE
ncbi:alpha-N-acetylgalactosaminidase-like [Aphomia sociella]